MTGCLGLKTCVFFLGGGGLLGFNASATARVISRRWNDDEISFLVEETGVPRGNHRPTASMMKLFTHTASAQSGDWTWAAAVQNLWVFISHSCMDIHMFYTYPWYVVYICVCCCGVLRFEAPPIRPPPPRSIHSLFRAEYVVNREA